METIAITLGMVTLAVGLVMSGVRECLISEFGVPARWANPVVFVLSFALGFALTGVFLG